MKQTIMIALPCLKTGGTEIQTLRLVEALTAEGYRCVAICYFEYDYRIVQLYESQGCEVVRLSAYGTRPQGTKAVYRFLKEGLRRAVKDYRPAVVHVQYVAPGALPIIILRRLGVKNLIATIHTDAHEYKSLRLVRMMQRRFARVFTCVSESAEKEFFGCSKLYSDALEIGRHEHLTLPNCLPQEKIEYTRQNSRHKVIGFISRLEAVKGAENIVPFFARLLTTNPDTKLLVVGDGSLRGEMQRQAKTYNIDAKKIEWRDMVQPQNIGKVYDECDVVWMPSKGEGFGLTAVESMAHGCVVVATAVGGLKDVIHNGDDGVLIDSDEIGRMPEVTSELLNDDEKMGKMSVAAAQRANEFRFDIYRKRVAGLYGKILA